MWVGLCWTICQWCEELTVGNSICLPVLQVARHPDFHLAPNELDQAKDAQLLDAMQAEDIADAAQDTQFEPSTAHSESSDYEFTFANKKEEMAALVSFLTSTSSNALPPVDPSMPLDPRE
jgi:hypothetical protein